MRSRQCFEFIRSRLPPEPLQRVEKASIDEVFLDLSAHVHRTLLQQFPHLAEEAIDPDLRLPLPDLDEPLSWEEDHVVTAKTATTTRPDWDDVALSIGAGIVRRLRAEVLEQFHLTCSAGVGCNKMLAKLAAGWRKPNQQTVLLHRAASEFLSSQKFTEIRGLGRKLGGEIKETFGSDRVVDLLQIPLQKLQAALGNKNGLWVHDAIRGYETSAVKSRIAVQSMLSAKTFVPNVIGFEQALKWIRIFAADLMGRLNELHADYPRRPTVVAVHHHIKGRFGPTRSKQTIIPAADVIDETALFTWAKDLLREISDEGLTWPCASLSMSISGFYDLVVRNERITSFFSRETTGQKRQTALLLARTSGDTDHPKKQRKIDLPDAGHLEGSYDCPQCHERINESKVLEHLDWHFATDLQASTGQEVETTDSDETALASLPVLRVPV
ncbi:hypothetical protein C7974DRAFT_393542 [Boeremia exigua]|uniref:uncharacterized protein n=1 Tax=Boeremia exigua TaxID=749465 RepID=UPI001E8CD852|nr:uncharacterized protein C7974DRAFT_393542 [Boeremia exigua]KAH6628965.1 hypothetical protein C7974DRAFT_393542 [Boeremia exigua]